MRARLTAIYQRLDPLLPTEGRFLVRLRTAFHRRIRHGTQNTITFSLRYEGPLPAANTVKVDITIIEALCFPLQERPILRTFDQFDDFPDGPRVKVYAIEEIVIEK